MTWDQDAICRVLDIKYRKELMSLSLPEKQCPVAVLAVLIVRGEKDGEWEVWPCAKYCNPSMPYTSQVVNDKDYQMFLCKFITKGEINKLFTGVSKSSDPSSFFRKLKAKSDIE